MKNIIYFWSNTQSPTALKRLSTAAVIPGLFVVEIIKKSSLLKDVVRKFTKFRSFWKIKKLNCNQNFVAIGPQKFDFWFD